MEDSIWTLAAQVIAVLILLAALLEGGLAASSSLKRYRHQQDVYRISHESFEEKLKTAQIRRVDRGRENATWNGFRKFRVARRTVEGGDICSFYLEPHDGKPIPTFRPGQYLTFGLDIPNEKGKTVRCYSLSAGPLPNQYRVSIKRVPPPREKPEIQPGKGSGFFHDHIQEGTIVDVKAPSGAFFLDLTEVSPIVLIGGGIGVTPMISMLNALEERGFNREVWFFLGVRNLSEHIMEEYFSRIADEHPKNLHVHFCYSDPDTDLPIDPPTEYHRGRISVELFKRVLPSNNFEYYICGPPPMMESLTNDLREWGVPDNKVFFETFGSASVQKTKKATAPGTADQAFKISFAKSGQDFEWDPGSGSLLEFAEDKGISMDSGCRAGSCGSCVTAIKSGAVEYVTEPGDPPDAGSCLTCISVPKSDLVLEA